MAVDRGQPLGQAPTIIGWGSIVPSQPHPTSPLVRPPRRVSQSRRRTETKDWAHRASRQTPVVGQGCVPVGWMQARGDPGSAVDIGLVMSVSRHPLSRFLFLSSFFFASFGDARAELRFALGSEVSLAAWCLTFFLPALCSCLLVSYSFSSSVFFIVHPLFPVASALFCFGSPTVRCARRGAFSRWRKKSDAISGECRAKAA